VYKTLLHDHARAIVAGRVKDGDPALAKKVVEYHAAAKRLLGKKLPPHWRTHALDSTTHLVVDTVPEGTLLFRGQKTLSALPSQKATYFALEIGNANQYLPTAKKGVLSVYRTRAPLHLLRLDSLDNVNRMLRETYDSNRPVYDVVRSMFLSKLLQIKAEKDPKWRSVLFSGPPEKEPVQFKRLVRNSVIKNDFVFANWLCRKGYQGYASGVMFLYEFGSLQESFPEEIMLCDPAAVLRVLRHTEMKKQKDRFALDRVLESFKAEPTT
jgi:hypothetical protein